MPPWACGPAQVAGPVARPPKRPPGRKIQEGLAPAHPATYLVAEHPGGRRLIARACSERVRRQTAAGSAVATSSASLIDLLEPQVTSPEKPFVSAHAPTFANAITTPQQPRRTSDRPIATTVLAQSVVCLRNG